MLFHGGVEQKRIWRLAKKPWRTAWRGHWRDAQRTLTDEEALNKPTIVIIELYTDEGLEKQVMDEK